MSLGFLITTIIVVASPGTGVDGREADGAGVTCLVRALLQSTDRGHVPRVPLSVTHPEVGAASIAV
jgi:hypothetical protein